MSWRAQGLRAWLLQRVTAVYLAAFTIAAAVWAVTSGPMEFAEWRAFMGRPAVSIAVLLFFAALLGHAWVGARDIVIDYLRPAALRLLVLALLALALVAMALWVGAVLFSVVSL